MSLSEIMSLHAGNTRAYVIDPHVRECVRGGGWGTDETEAAVDAICTLVPKLRSAGIPIHFIWSKLDVSGEFQEPQGLRADDPAFMHLTTSFETSLGGFHPKILKLMEGGGSLHEKFTTSALKAPSIRHGIVKAGPGNDLLLGFNFSRCVSDFGIEIKADKSLPQREAYILSDCVADNSRVAHEELYSDSGIGESLHSILRRATGVRVVRSSRVMDALGIS